MSMRGPTIVKPAKRSKTQRRWNQNLRRTLSRHLQLESLEARDLMATRVWDGGGGNNNWTTAVNWVGNVAPVAGDDLVFTGNTRTSPVNDFANGTAFNSITFDASASNFVITGNRIALNGGTDISSAAGIQHLYTPLTLSTASEVNVTGTALVLVGIIDGSGSLVKTGASQLNLHGASTFSGGLTIKAGSVYGIASSSAFGSGTITLGETGGSADAILGSALDGTYTNAITVAAGNGVSRIRAANATASTFSGAITLSSHDLRLDTLLGNSLSITGGISSLGSGGNVIMDATSTGVITIGGSGINTAGTITNSGAGSATNVISGPVGGNVTGITQSSTTSALNVSGALTVNSTLTTLTNTSGTKALTVSGGISGTGALALKNNSATDDGIVLSSTSVNLAGAITNSGSGAGKVTIAAPVGGNVTDIILNSTTSALVVSGALTVNSTLTTLTNSAGITSLTISGGTTGTGHLALKNNSSTNGGIYLSTNSVNHTGTIRNSGSGSGSVGISTVGSNTSGITQDSTTSAMTVSGVVTVNGTLTTLTNIAGTKSLTVSGGITGTGHLALKNNSATDNGIVVSISSVNHVGTLTNSGTGTGSVAISAVVGANVTSVTQNSSSSMLSLEGPNTYLGVTNINYGRVYVAAGIADGPATDDVVVAAGSRLEGTGTFNGRISVSGELAPKRTFASGVTFSSGAKLALNLGGVNPGYSTNTYDQLVITSSSLVLGANVTLDLTTSGGFVPTYGNAFTIIDKLSTGAISGTFAGLPEGAVFNSPAGFFQISYVGGTGNDVVLTAVTDVFVLQSVTAVDGNLQVTYDLSRTIAGSFSIGLYVSPNGSTLGAALTTTVVTESALRTAGTGHVKNLATNFSDPGGDYYLVVVLDSTNSIVESDEANNQKKFAGGAFVDSNNNLHIHRGDESENTSLSLNGVNLSVAYTPAVPPPYWDTNGDGQATQADIDKISQLLLQIYGDPIDNDPAPHPWMNPDNPYDVNHDGRIDEDDPAELTSHLNASGAHALTGSPQPPDPIYLDPNGDGSVSPLDPLTIIGYLNASDPNRLWTNYHNPWDVNGDGTITTSDITLLQAAIPEIYTVSFTSSAINNIYIRTHDGNDIVKLGSGITQPTWIYGGNGDDSITTSSDDPSTVSLIESAEDHVYGGAGDDTIATLGGNDYAFGGDGNDWLYGGLGNDVLEGGAGADELHGDAGADQLDGGTGSDEVYGDAGDDTLTDGDGAFGSGGVQDILDGGTGNDTNASTGGNNSHTSLSMAGTSESNTTDHAPGVLGGDIFIVPGMIGEMVTINFEWAYRNAGFNNEIGIYFVENELGSVKGVLPGKAGYAAAALFDAPGAEPDNFRVVFASGQSPGPSDPTNPSTPKPIVPINTSISLVAGTRFSFYMVQNGTTAQGASGARATLFKINQANFDASSGTQHGFPHFLPSESGDPGHVANRLSYKVEDLRPSDGGFDRDYNDVVFSLYIERTLSLAATNKYAREIDPQNSRELVDPGFFTVSRGEAAVGTPISVNYEVVSGGSGPHAVAGDVAESFSGSVSIAADKANGVITFTPVNDAISEWDEDLELQITEVTNPNYYTSPTDYTSYYASPSLYPASSVASPASTQYQTLDPTYPTRATIIPVVYLAPGNTASITILDDDGVAGEVNRNIDPATTGQSQLSVGNGMIDVDLQQGDVQLTLALAPAGYLPTYRSNDNLHPLVSLEWVPPSTSLSGPITATLTFGNVTASPVQLTIPSNSGDEPLRLVLLGSDSIATQLATGHYDYDIKLQYVSGSDTQVRTIRGTSEIVNLLDADKGSTELGKRWWIDGLDRIVPNDGNTSRLASEGLAAIGGMSIIRGDNSSAWYVGTPTQYRFDDTPAFTVSSDWNTGTYSGAYGGSYRYTTTEGSLATWQFTGLQSNRQYQVFATWVPDASRSDAVSYNVSGKKVHAEFQDWTTINQRFTPGEVVVNGTAWRSLGFVAPNSGMVSVYAYLAGTGEFVADAIMLVEDWSYEDAIGSYDVLDQGSLEAPISGYDPQNGTFTIHDKYETRKEFNYQGLLQRVVDRNQNKVEFTYADADSDGLQDEISRITQQGNLQTNYTYTGGKLSKVTDFAGRETTFVNSGGQVTEVKMPLLDGQSTAYSTTFEYGGPSSLLSKVTDAKSHATNISYGSGTYRVSSAQNADGNSWAVESFLVSGLNEIHAPASGAIGDEASTNPNARDEPVATYTDPRQKIWTYQTDNYGLATASANPLDKVWHWERQSYGQPIKLTQPAGGGGDTALGELETSYEYDIRGNLTRIIFPDDAVGAERRETFSYDTQFSQRTSSTDRQGQVTNFALDSRGNVSTQTEVAGSGPNRVTAFTYSSAPSSISSLPGGLVTLVTYASGSSDSAATQTQYYSSGAKIGLVQQTTVAYGTSDAATTSYDYDAQRNPSTGSLLGRVTNYSYDKLNRLLSVELPDPGSGDHGAPETTYEYDAVGNRVAVIDARSKRTDYTFDQMNRLEKVELPMPGGDSDSTQSRPTTEYAYDANGNLLTLTDALGHETTYAYDDRNLRTSTMLPSPNSSVSSPGGSASAPSFEYEYDTLGNLKTETDARGNETSYRYDKLQRRDRITEPSTVDHGAPVTTYVFDALGRIEEVTAPGPNGQVTTEYEYDRFGRTTQIKLPQAGSQQPTTLRTYDLRGNLKSETDPKERVTSYTYNLRDQQITASIPNPSGSGTQQTSYAVNAFGEVTSITTLDRTSTTEYDDLGRVIKSTQQDPDGAGPQSALETIYKYDEVGNVLEVKQGFGSSYSRVASAYDDLNRPYLTQDYGTGGNAVASRSAYDLNGNLIKLKEEVGAVGSTHERVTDYVYDDLNRLVSRTDPAPTSGAARSTYQYGYDEMGNTTYTRDARGNWTELQVDALNRTKKVLSPALSSSGNQQVTSEIIYKTSGDVGATVDPLSRTTTNTFDNLSRTVSTQLPAVTAGTPGFSYEYDLAGNVVSSTDAENITTTVSYNAWDQVTESIRDGIYNVSHYDQYGQLTSVQTGPQSALVTTQWFTYDILGRQVRTIEPKNGGTPGVQPLEEVLADTDATRASTATPGWELNSTLDAYEIDADGIETTTATWSQLSLDTDKDYFIFASWDADLTSAGAVDYRFYNGSVGGGNQIGSTITVDQSDLSSDVVLDNRSWQLLGKVRVASGDLFVQLDASGSTGLVRAGSLRVVEAAPGSFQKHDAWGNVLAVTDGEGRTTKYTYDAYFRVSGVTDPNGDTTHFEYDVLGRRTKVTDPLGNETSFVYDDLDRLIEERITLDSVTYTRTRTYDLDGNLAREIDRNGRVRVYQYDEISRLVGETWYGNLSDANSQLNPLNSITYEYDLASHLIEISDANSHYEYGYDALDRVTSTTDENDASVPVVLANHYARLDGLRTSLSATVGGVADFKNVYAYDDRLRLTQVTQQGQSGGYTVGEKRVNFSYNARDQFEVVTRHADLAGSDFVASTEYGYDSLHRLATLEHLRLSTTLASYSYVYDAASRITQLTSVDGVANYTYDARGQLIVADYNYQADESFGFDENGNREGIGYSTGDHNRPESDPQFDYEYDAEGNRTRRTDNVSGAVTEYHWDTLNRLVRIVSRPLLNDPPTAIIEYTYDVYGRRILKQIDTDGDSEIDIGTRYVYDGDDIVLSFDDNGELTHRYLQGPAIDQILADEQVSWNGVGNDYVTDNLYWPLTDHQGTVRDVAQYDALGDDSDIVNHIVYSAFGVVTSESDPGIDLLYGFTGRERDEESGLNYHRARYLDPTIGQWLSEDPMGFGAGDANLRRYVSNDPVNRLDPTGYADKIIGPGNSKDALAGRIQFVDGKLWPGGSKTYGIGIRVGEIVYYEGKAFYYSDLVAAAESGEINSEADLKTFIESASLRYKTITRLQQFIDRLDKIAAHDADASYRAFALVVRNIVARKYFSAEMAQLKPGEVSLHVWMAQSMQSVGLDIAKYMAEKTFDEYGGIGIQVWTETETYGKLTEGYPGPAGKKTLVWLDRSGKAIKQIAPLNGDPRGVNVLRNMRRDQTIVDIGDYGSLVKPLIILHNRFEDVQMMWQGRKVVQQWNSDDRLDNLESLAGGIAIVSHFADRKFADWGDFSGVFKWYCQQYIGSGIQGAVNKLRKIRDDALIRNIDRYLRETDLRNTIPDNNQAMMPFGIKWFEDNATKEELDILNRSFRNINFNR